MSEEDHAAMLKQRAEEELRRMTALADSFGIEDGPFRWYFVALRLALEHVPELQESKPRGAPEKWSAIEHAVLAVEIERRTEQGKTIEEAAQALALVDPWKSFLSKKEGTYAGPDPTAALVKQYKKAKNGAFTTIYRKGFRQFELEGGVDVWEREHVLTVGKRK